MGKFIDLTGDVYGKLEVIKRVENRGEQSIWLCKCECGNIKEVARGNLKSGNTTSCGVCPVNILGEFKDDHVVGHTQKGDKFLVDRDVYKEVSKYTWIWMG